MGTRERRQELMRENDDRVTQARERFLAEHAPDPDDEPRRHLAARRFTHEKVELVCECGREACTDAIHVDGDDYNLARATAGAFLCEPMSIRVDQERVLRAAGPQRDFVIAEPLPDVGAVPEVETLKLHLDGLKRENDSKKADVNAALTRIAAAATAGTLVFGIYAALRPKDAETLATGWVIAALAPFLGLVLTSLFGPRAIRRWLAKQLHGSRITFEDIAKWRERRMQDFPTNDFADHWEQVRAPGATYETFDRRDAARKDDPLNPEAFLAPRDWLSIEIQRQTRLRLAYMEADRKAERREGEALFWLAVLIVYIVLVTFLA